MKSADIMLMPNFANNVSFKRKLRIAFGVVTLVILVPIPFANMISSKVGEKSSKAKNAVTALNGIIRLEDSIGTLQSAGVDYAQSPTAARNAHLLERLELAKLELADTHVSQSADRKLRAQTLSGLDEAVLELQQGIHHNLASTGLVSFNTILQAKVHPLVARMSDHQARVATASHTNLTRQVKNHVTMIGNSLIIGFLLAVTLALLLPRSLVRRLVVLQLAAQKLAVGDLAARAKLTGRDEIGSLAQDFNHMADALAKREQESQELLDRERERATRDPLTSMRNHQYFHEQLKIEISRATRTNKPFTLVLIDLDDFKQVNDTFGHQAGDTVLLAVALAFAQTTRATDVAGRLGGEEFGLLLPETDHQAAIQLLTRIKSELRGCHPSGGDVQFSAGICCYDDSINSGELYERADSATYEAKRSGKNRNVVWHEPNEANSDNEAAA